MTIRQRLMRRMKGVMLKYMHGMITCREFEAFVIDYVDDSLPSHQCKIFELHLKFCRECREYLAAYQQTKALSTGLRENPNAPVPRNVPEDLVKAVLEALNK